MNRNENQIITYESVLEKLQRKKLEEYTKKDVIDRYVANGSQEELSKAKIQQLFIRHQLYDELLGSLDGVIEDKVVIQNLLGSHIFDKPDIFMIDGKIIDIRDKRLEESNTELDYTTVIIKENSTSKLYEINIAVFFHFQGFEEYKQKIQQYYENDLIAVVRKDHNKLQIIGFLKKFNDINYANF